MSYNWSSECRCGCVLEDVNVFGERTWIIRWRIALWDVVHEDLWVCLNREDTAVCNGLNNRSMVAARLVVVTMGDWICSVNLEPGCPEITGCLQLLEILEFEMPSGNTGNLLEFNCSSWKFLCNRSVIHGFFSYGPVIGKLASTVY